MQLLVAIIKNHILRIIYNLINLRLWVSECKHNSREPAIGADGFNSE